ncbi:unnamed protein product, partial [Schistosoma turkestanicum]
YYIGNHPLILVTGDDKKIKQLTNNIGLWEIFSSHVNNRQIKHLSPSDIIHGVSEKRSQHKH